MRRGKIVIWLFTALLLAVIVFLLSRDDPWNGNLPLSVLVSSQGQTEEIGCWKSDTGEYFLFLPSYADLSQTQIRINSRYPVHMDGRLVTDGMSCDFLQLDVPYDLTCAVDGEARHFSLTILQSGNLPALYIDVASGTMDYIHEEKGNKEAGALRLYTADGALAHSGNLDALEGRGNSSWNCLKKPYNLTLPAETDLLEMGQAQRWILLANAYDPSQLRNKIAYDFADAAGLAYTPDCEWVELYLNGEYAGLYLLSERNEIHPQRVAVPEAGSFLVSKEWEWRMSDRGQPFVTLNSRAALRIHQSDLSPEALTQVFQSAENAILAEDSIDPLTGKTLTELIDLDSWAKKYLIEEIFGNVDASTLSQYFYYDGRDEDGKLYAGPIWDFDLSMGNTVASPVQSPNIFYANKPNVYASPWFSTLYQKDVFYQRITELYQTDFLPLLEELLDTGIDRYAAQVSRAAGMDQIRWSGTAAAEETEHIKTYLTERMAFLNSAWIDGDPYCTVLVDCPAGYMRYAVAPGDTLPELPFESTADSGWYLVDTDEPFDITQPIYEDTAIIWKQPAAEAAPESAESEQFSPLRFGPVTVFAVMLILLCLADRIRWKRVDTQKHGRTEHTQIPS